MIYSFLNPMRTAVCLLFISSLSFAGAADSKNTNTGRSYKEFSSVTFSGDNSSSVIFVSALQFLETQQNDSFLMQYNTQTGEESRAQLPIALQGRTLLALFPFEGSESKVYVVSQLHKAGADKPRIDLHDFSSGSWKTIKDNINCVTFSQLRIEGAGKMKMACGENFLFPPDEASFEISLDQAIAKKLVRDSQRLEVDSNGTRILFHDSKLEKVRDLSFLLQRFDKED